MTAIRGAIIPTRRPGELGVHSVDRFHFAVPDLAIAKNFYGEFGLEIDEDGGHLAVKTRGNPHVWVTLGEGQRKKLGHISFGAFDDDFDRFAQRLLALGIKRLDPPRGVETNGLWFHDHDGNLIEIKVVAKSSPNEKSAAARARAPRLSGAMSRASRLVASRMFSCSRATSRRRSSSIRVCWACGFPTVQAKASPFCTAYTAAIIT
jgi:catechol 2,3-dioxygenase-like lactoylglutathione lyase family enzyme